MRWLDVRAVTVPKPAIATVAYSPARPRSRLQFACLPFPSSSPPRQSIRTEGAVQKAQHYRLWQPHANTSGIGRQVEINRGCCQKAVSPPCAALCQAGPPARCRRVARLLAKAPA